MEIVRGRLSAADYSNPSLRYNADCDCIQFTPDNGTTWVDTPSADPRHSDIYRKPPLVSDDPRCDAAANMVKWMKDFIDYVTGLLEAGALAFTLVNTAIELMSIVFPPDLFVLPITEACETLFAVGGGALLAAFDSEQYELLQCIFFCNTQTDGSVNASGFAVIQEQITATLNTTAGVVVNLLLSLQGEVGLSNAGVVGGQTGDCTSCACRWCYSFDLALTDAGLTIATQAGWDNPFGAYTSGVGYETILSHNASAGFYAQLVEAQNNALPPGNYTRVDLYFTEHPGSPTGANYIQMDGDAVFHAVIDGDGLLTWEGNLDNPAQLDFQLNPGFGGAPPGGSATATRLVFFGFGDNPFGVDNC